MKKKTCPECGKEFRCDGDNDCWCEGKQIHKAPMLEIMQRYTDCICPDCLKKYGCWKLNYAKPFRKV